MNHSISVISFDHLWKVLPWIHVWLIFVWPENNPTGMPGCVFLLYIQGYHSSGNPIQPVSILLGLLTCCFSFFVIKIDKSVILDTEVDSKRNNLTPLFNNEQLVGPISES